MCLFCSAGIEVSHFWQAVSFQNGIDLKVCRLPPCMRKTFDLCYKSHEASACPRKMAPEVDVARELHSPVAGRVQC